MAIRNIRYQDDPILSKRCKEVAVVDHKIRQLLDDMIETSHYTENGAAMAANKRVKRLLLLVIILIA